MATAIIFDDIKHKVRTIETDKVKTAKVKYKPIGIQIEYKLPFRLRFTNIKVPGYGPNNVPPIPLQVIGYSNYIM